LIVLLLHFLLPAIASRSGEAGGDERQKGPQCNKLRIARGKNPAAPEKGLYALVWALASSNKAASG